MRQKQKNTNFIDKYLPPKSAFNNKFIASLLVIPTIK